MRELLLLRIAIVGSRNAQGIPVDFILPHIPPNASEIVSGGAEGIDSLAKEAAAKLGLKLTEFLPDYEAFGKRAPMLRNIEIVKFSDYLIAFWDHQSKGTAFTIEQCIKLGVPFKVVSI